MRFFLNIMGKRALLSNHLVVPSISPTPVRGLILIHDEIICEVIILDESLAISEIFEKYQDWDPEDLSDFYISPGIIDLNSRVEWESYTGLSKSAVSGGVTFALIENSIYHEVIPNDILYCDIGKVIVPTEYPIRNLKELEEKGYFAVKIYLFPPNHTLPRIPEDFDEDLETIENSSMLLIIDPTLPDERMFYSVSPFHFRDISDRLRTDIKQEMCFSAGFADLIEPEEDFLETPKIAKNCKEIQKSLITEEVKNPELNKIPEKKLNLSTTSLKLPKISLLNLEDMSPGTKDFDDFDRQVDGTQMVIQNLSVAEYHTYHKSGVTQFSSSSNPSPVWSASPLSASSSLSLPISSHVPTIFQRRKMNSSFTIVVDSIKTHPVEEEIYSSHMANYPHTWETSGLEKLLKVLKTSQCKAHICNISSAVAFNKIRKLKEIHTNFTCELPASHLYFHSNLIKNNDTRFKNTPPFRNQTNADLLWELLKMETINTITSQHACIDPQYKMLGKSFTKAVNGVNCLGFTLQAVWSKMVKHLENEKFLVKLAKWLSENPSEILGVQRTRGSIEKGKLADLIVWDPYEKFVAGAENSKFPEMSPYVGEELWGKIKMVFLRGNTVYNQGAFTLGGRCEKRKYYLL